MSRVGSTALLPLLLVAACPAVGEELPRVLLLGDANYLNLSRTVANELKGRATVVARHPGDSTTALANLEGVLGDQSWAVIHFNFGLADLHYRDPATKAVRAMSKRAGGVRVSSPERYEKNLDALVGRLKATGAKLIWASTTPIPSSKLDDLVDPGSEVEYNAIAAKVMERHDVTVNDVHGHVTKNAEGKKLTDPFSVGRVVPLHPPVVEAIAAALGKPASK